MFLFFDEFHSHAIHAVAQSCGFRPIIKNVSEVSVASRAQHFSPRLAQAVINLFPHVLFGNRRPEARPARVRFKLCPGAKQRQFTGDAFKDTFLVNVIERTCIGRFSSLLTRHVVLLRCENAFPLLVSLNDFLNWSGLLASRIA